MYKQTVSLHVYEPQEAEGMGDHTNSAKLAPSLMTGCCLPCSQLNISATGGAISGSTAATSSTGATSCAIRIDDMWHGSVVIHRCQQV